MATINTNKVNETNTITPVGGVGLAQQAACPQIFRYKLSDNIMSLITQFAKIHQYDDRHSYKDAWLNQWLNDYGELVEREISRLEQLGYKGDVIDKMFKAGRYYFREKESLEKKKNDVDTNDDNNANTNASEADASEADANKPRRTYCVMKPDVIKAMDTHLISIMKEPKFKPANGYKQFCEQHMDILRVEIARLIQEGTVMTAEKLSEKIKKTYKNRYYILSKQSHDE
jgi:hypothetical protein